jgi:hypothetical protein
MGVVEPPTEDEVRILREEVDPKRVYLKDCPKTPR